MTNWINSTLLSRESNITSMTAPEMKQGIAENHLEALYRFLRQSAWDSTVLPLTIYVGILATVGFLGNVLVIMVYVYNRKHSRSRTSGWSQGSSQTLVMWLAAVDLVVCLLAMPGQLVRTWYIPWHSDFVCKLWDFLVHTTLPISAAILVAIAHDRHTLLCRPTHHNSPQAQRRQLALTIAGAITLGLCFGVPPALTVGVYQASLDGSRYYLGLCEVNGIIMSRDALNNYWYVLLAFYLLILVLLLVMYSAILASVWKHVNSRKHRFKGKVTPAALPPSSTTSNNKGSKGCFFRHRRLVETTDSQMERNGQETEDFGVVSVNTEENSNTIPLVEIHVANIQVSSNRPQNKSNLDPVSSNQITHEQTDTEQTNTQSPASSLIKDASCKKELFEETTEHPDPESNHSKGTTDRYHQKRSQNKQANLEQHSHTVPSNVNYVPTVSPNTENIHHTSNTSENQTGNNRITEQTDKPHIKSQSPKPLCPAHIKTAVMFFLITLTFFASYVPTFLMMVDAVAAHPVWYYTYYIHSVVNPLLYSAANAQFRNSAKQLFTCQ